MTPRDFCVWLDGYLCVARILDGDYLEDVVRELTEQLQTVKLDGEPDGDGRLVIHEDGMSATGYRK